jgi:hypothetical protein
MMAAGGHFPPGGRGRGHPLARKKAIWSVRQEGGPRRIPALRDQDRNKPRQSRTMARQGTFAMLAG